jgi:plastocyanin
MRIILSSFVLLLFLKARELRAENQPEIHQVILGHGGDVFSPAVLTANVGDTIVFVFSVGVPINCL